MTLQDAAREMRALIDEIGPRLDGPEEPHPEVRAANDAARESRPRVTVRMQDVLDAITDAISEGVA